MLLIALVSFYGFFSSYFPYIIDPALFAQTGCTTLYLCDWCDRPAGDPFYGSQSFRITQRYHAGKMNMAKSLLQQNIWLRDEVKRKAALQVSAASSSAVEGIYKPFTRDTGTIRNVRRSAARSSGPRG